MSQNLLYFVLRKAKAGPKGQDAHHFHIKHVVDREALISQVFYELCFYLHLYRGPKNIF